MLVHHDFDQWQKSYSSTVSSSFDGIKTGDAQHRSLKRRVRVSITGSPQLSQVRLARMRAFFGTGFSAF